MMGLAKNEMILIGVFVVIIFILGKNIVVPPAPTTTTISIPLGQIRNSFCESIGQGTWEEFTGENWESRTVLCIERECQISGLLPVCNGRLICDDNEVDYVCGFDGITYQNMCIMLRDTNEQVYMAYRGECGNPNEIPGVEFTTLDVSKIFTLETQSAQATVSRQNCLSDFAENTCGSAKEYSGECDGTQCLVRMDDFTTGSHAVIRGDYFRLFWHLSDGVVIEKRYLVI